MKRSRDQFASVIAADLRAVEHSLDETLARSGALLQNLAQGRRTSGLAASVGQPGLLSLGEAIRGVIDVRGHVVQAHSRFAEEAQGMGMIWTTIGPFEDKPTDGTKENPRPTGQLVQSE